MTHQALKTKLCELLGIEYPILLAGMGVLGMATPPRLVSAVSNAGGMGFAACSQNIPEWVRRTILPPPALHPRAYAAGRSIIR